MFEDEDRRCEFTDTDYVGITSVFATAAAAAAAAVRYTLLLAVIPANKLACISRVCWFRYAFIDDVPFPPVAAIAVIEGPIVITELEHVLLLLLLLLLLTPAVVVAVVVVAFYCDRLFISGVCFIPQSLTTDFALTRNFR